MLITHAIGPQLCSQRQREHYHKCHRCAYRGRGADFRLEGDPAGSGLDNGVAAKNGHAPEVPPLEQG